jgi:hypothetical protein
MSGTNARNVRKPEEGQKGSVESKAANLKADIDARFAPQSCHFQQRSECR